MKGWECPKCHKVYSPAVEECKGCNSVFDQYPKTPIEPYKWPKDGTGDFPIPQFPNTTEESCLIDGFLKQNPNYNGPILISCPCRKCTPYCGSGGFTCSNTLETF